MTDFKHTLQCALPMYGFVTIWFSSCPWKVKIVSITSIKQTDSPPPLPEPTCFLTDVFSSIRSASRYICSFRLLFSSMVLFDPSVERSGAAKTIAVVNMTTARVCRCFISSKKELCAKSAGMLWVDEYAAHCTSLLYCLCCEKPWHHKEEDTKKGLKVTSSFR